MIEGWWESIGNLIFSEDLTMKGPAGARTECGHQCSQGFFFAAADFFGGCGVCFHLDSYSYIFSLPVWPFRFDIWDLQTVFQILLGKDLRISDKEIKIAELLCCARHLEVLFFFFNLSFHLSSFFMLHFPWVAINIYKLMQTHKSIHTDIAVPSFPGPSLGSPRIHYDRI